MGAEVDYQIPPLKCPDCGIRLMPLFKDSPVLVCYDCERKFLRVVK